MKKFVVIGDGGCGKTCLLNVYCHDHFDDSYSPTFDNFHEHEVDLDGTKIKITLVDAIYAYDKLYPLYCRDANVILVCFSICDPPSLSNIINFWKPDLLDVYCKGVPILVIGNKKDLREDPKERFGRIISEFGHKETLNYEDGLRVAEKINAVGYFECSARKKEGIAEIFKAAIWADLRKSKDSSQLANKKKKGKCSLS